MIHLFIFSFFSISRGRTARRPVQYSFSIVFKQTGGNVREKLAMAALIRVEEKILAEETEEVSVLARIVYLYSPSVRLFVLYSYKVNVFKNLVALMTTWRRRDSSEKPWEKCSSRRSTWRSQFGRYALLGEKSSSDFSDNESGKLLAGFRKKSRHVNAAFKYRSNSCEFVRPPTRLRCSFTARALAKRFSSRPLNEAHYLVP